VWNSLLAARFSAQQTAAAIDSAKNGDWSKVPAQVIGAALVGAGAKTEAGEAYPIEKTAPSVEPRTPETIQNVGNITPELIKAQAQQAKVNAAGIPTVELADLTQQQLEPGFQPSASESPTSLTETAADKAMRTTTQTPLKSAAELAMEQTPLTFDVSTGETQRPVEGFEPNEIHQLEQPQGQATVRLYHGSSSGDHVGTDFTPSYDYARGYADRSGTGGQVYYVDVPSDSKFLERDEGADNRLLNKQTVPEEYRVKARIVSELQTGEPQAGQRDTALSGPAAVGVAGEPATGAEARQAPVSPRGGEVSGTGLQGTEEYPRGSGISTERLQQIYGKDSVLVNQGKGPAEWQAIGQADKRDPYAVLSQARKNGIAPPQDAPLLRAEHQRLLDAAKASYGTPEYRQRLQNAADFANATKQVVHGPAADLMRGLQENDKPRYDSPVDFDSIMQERIGRESSSAEKKTFENAAADVKEANTRQTEIAETAKNNLSRYRPKDVMKFEDAVDNVRQQIKDLTEPCTL
jgi:hypothetical protein